MTLVDVPRQILESPVAKLMYVYQDLERGRVTVGYLVPESGQPTTLAYDASSFAALDPSRLYEDVRLAVAEDAEKPLFVRLMGALKGLEG